MLTSKKLLRMIFSGLAVLCLIAIGLMFVHQQVNAQYYPETFSDDEKPIIMCDQYYGDVEMIYIEGTPYMNVGVTVYNLNGEPTDLPISNASFFWTLPSGETGEGAPESGPIEIPMVGDGRYSVAADVTIACENGEVFHGRIDNYMEILGTDEITSDNAEKHFCQQGNTIVGTWGPDTLIGSPQNDTMEGKPGKDTLYGYECHDVLHGGWGYDKCYGGPGNDTFISCSVAEQQGLK